MSEPVQKRPRLDENSKSVSFLSDPNEPLKQRDVIYFQKEALFRCLNERRSQVNVIQNKFDSLKADYSEVTKTLSNIIAVIVTLAKFLESSIVSNNEGAANPDDFSILKKISSGDEDTIIELNDSFMKILMKYLDQDKKDSIDLQKLSNDIKVLQSDKKSLIIQNNTLVKQLDQLNSYYESLFRKYDRRDSLSLKRVFDKEGEVKIEENSGNPNVENNSSSSNSNSVNSNADMSVNSEVNADSNVKNVLIKTESTSNTNPHNRKDIIGAITDGNSSQKFQEYEDKIIDLKNKIDSMQIIVKNLESSNKSNYEKILKLENELLATNDRNKELITTQDTYLNKIESLTEENNELNKINDSYLKKYQTLVKEREVFSQKVAESLQNKLDNLLKVNNSLEKDLVRIRTTRDDLLSKIAILESQTKKSELIEDITKALELSNEQWSKFTNEGNNNNRSSINSGDSDNNTSSSNEQLLIKEIKDMEIAFKKLTALNNKKYMTLLNHESIISKLTIEKSKADQKYFASMRSKDSILVENKNLLKTVNKSNEFIVQLKDTEKILQDKIKSLQEQITLLENNGKFLMNTNKLESRKFNDLNNDMTKLKKINEYYKGENSKYVIKLNETVKERDLAIKDKEILEMQNKQSQEVISKLQESLKSKGLNVSKNMNEDNDSLTEELENFRTLVYCSLCSKNWKSSAIRTCGHTFCEDCVKERLAARMRKCPTCNHPFAATDLVTIHL